MQASALTFSAAKSYARASIRLACAMALDLSTLSDLKGFDFQTYNELLSEQSGLALGSVRNTMTAAKKLVTKYPGFYANLSEEYGLSDMALTRATEHTTKLLKDGSYGTSLPELLACLNEQASPMLTQQAARAEAAKAANEALMLAALQGKQAPEQDEQDGATVQALAADAANTEAAQSWCVIDSPTVAPTVADTVAPTVADTQIVNEAHIYKSQHISFTLAYACPSCELYDLIDQLIDRAKVIETMELLAMAEQARPVVEQAVPKKRKEKQAA